MFVKENKLLLLDSLKNKGRKFISFKEIYKRSKFVKSNKRLKWLIYLYVRWLNTQILKLTSYFYIPYGNKNFHEYISLLGNDNCRFVLGTIHQSKEYVFYETRLTENLGVCESKPLKIFEFKSQLELPARLSINTFIGTNIKNINCIVLEGYINYDDELNQTNTESFYYKITKEFIHEYRNNLFWATFNIIIPKEIRSFSNNINIFVSKYSVVNSDYWKRPSIKNQLIINKINYNTGKNKTPKLIIVLSFDGISNVDMNPNNDDKLFPALSSFSKKSLSFSNAFSSASTTGSTAASFTTGLGLSRHMIYDYEKNTNQGSLPILSPKITTMPELLNMNGYSCYGLTTFTPWRPHFGHARGFTEYRNCSSGNYHSYPYLENIFNYIEKAQETPVYIFLHLPGAHPPLRLGSYSNIKTPNLAAYYSTITEVDLQFRSIISLIKNLEIYHQSLIIFTSDHGRAIDPYHLRTYQFLEERIRVPLFVKFHESYDNLGAERVNLPVSNSSQICKIILEATNAEMPDYYDKLSERKFNGITWVCEAVDYKCSPLVDRYGIVGVDNDYKWVIYFNFDCHLNKILDFDEIIINKIGTDGIYNDKINIADKLSQNKIDNAIMNAKNYLKEGIKFSNCHPPVQQKDENTIFYESLF